MFSTEQRRVAIETFMRFDHSYADAVAELGRPDRATLRLWRKECESTGEVPVCRGRRKSKYTDDRAHAAVDCHLEHGRSLGRTRRAPGHPKSGGTLRGWIDELAPGERKRRGPNPRKSPAPTEERVLAVAELGARGGSAAEVAERRGA